MDVKLRKLREKNNISQEKMADVLNISQPQYCRKESNMIGFTEQEWNLLSEYLKIPLEDIKTEEAKVVQNNNGTTTNFAYIINVSDQLVHEVKEHNNTLKEIVNNQKIEIEYLKSIIKENFEK